MDKYDLISIAFKALWTGVFIAAAMYVIAGIVVFVSDRRARANYLLWRGKKW